jgi:putative phosphoribosyl transferase
VGFEVAQRFRADMDVFLARKIGVPGREELAIGAVGPGGVRVLNEPIIEALEIPPAVVDRATERELREIERRERLYREGLKPIDPARRTVVLVDDGLATGATMLAAVRALRLKNPARIIVAIPVASRHAYDELRKHADEVVCLETPEPFDAVGIWYQDFSQITDEQVRELLERASQEHVA